MERVKVVKVKNVHVKDSVGKEKFKGSKVQDCQNNGECVKLKDAASRQSRELN